MKISLIDLNIPNYKYMQSNSMGKQQLHLIRQHEDFNAFGTSLLSIAIVSSPAVVCIQLSVDYLFLGESRLCCYHLPILDLALNPAYALFPKREYVCNMKSLIEQLFQSSYRDYGLGQNPVGLHIDFCGDVLFLRTWGLPLVVCYTSMIRLLISLHACTTM